MSNILYEEQEIKRLAARYRLSLENISLEDQPIVTSLEQNLILEKILNGFTGLKTESTTVLKSSDYNFFLKNIKTFVYSYFKIYSTYLRNLDVSLRENLNIISEIEDFYKKQEANFESIKKKLTTPSSDFIVRKSFSQRNLNETYDLIDKKRNNFFRKYELANSRESTIHSSIKNESLITPKKASVFGRSKNSEKFEKSEETSKLWRKDKRYKYIVFKEEKEEAYKETMSKAELNIEFDFGTIQKFNKINIDFGSYLPSVVNKNKLLFLDEETKSWEPIQVFYNNENIKKEKFWLNTFETRKIRICLEQYKSLNKVSESFLSIDEKFSLEILNPAQRQSVDKKMYEVYDLSIDHIEFNYEKYFCKSIYREKNYIEIDNLEYLNLEVNTIEAPLSFVESEIEVQYYLDGKGRWSWDILPIPTSYKIKEVLYVKKKSAVLTFPIMENSDDTKIYNKVGDELDENNYQIKYIDDSNKNLIYNTYIELNNPTADDFYIEYAVNNKINYVNAVYENNTLKFKDSLKGKRALVRPRFIFRSLNKESTSNFITRYVLEKNAKVDDVNISSEYKLLKG